MNMKPCPKAAELSRARECPQCCGSLILHLIFVLHGLVSFAVSVTFTWFICCSIQLMLLEEVKRTGKTERRVSGQENIILYLLMFSLVVRSCSIML